MAQIRYGARTPAQLEDREVKATSVGAWSTSLTASYETDPELIAAVLPPPLSPTDQPLVRVSVATVDLGESRPPFGAGTFAVRAAHGDTVGYYPAGHAHDHRAVGDRRAGDLRGAQEAGPGRADAATATRYGAPSPAWA